MQCTSPILTAIQRAAADLFCIEYYLYIELNGVLIDWISMTLNGVCFMRREKLCADGKSLRKQ